MRRQRLTSKTAASKDSSRKQVDGRELDGFEYDKTKAKILKRVLHNLNVSQGTLIAAMKEISTMRGSEISPDGKLGGKGFIMPFREIKQIINEAVGNLSDVTDTLADELTNPMWGLSSTEKKKVKKEQEQVEDKVEEAEEIIEEDPEMDVPENLKSDDNDSDDGDSVIEETVEEPESSEVSEENSAKESSEDVNKYRDLLLSPRDKTAGTLSRNIMANLLTGEK
jgi:hypothetical protein